MATALKLDIHVATSDETEILLVAKHGISSSKILAIPKSASRSKVFRGATHDQAYQLVLNTQSGQCAQFAHFLANHGTYIEMDLDETRSNDEFRLRPNKNVIFASIDLTDAYYHNRAHLGK